MQWLYSFLFFSELKLLSRFFSFTSKLFLYFFLYLAMVLSSQWWIFVFYKFPSCSGVFHKSVWVISFCNDFFHNPFFFFIEKLLPFLSYFSFKSKINNGKWSVNRAGNASMLWTNFGKQLEMKIKSNRHSINPVKWICLSVKFRVLKFLTLQISQMSIFLFLFQLTFQWIFFLAIAYHPWHLTWN